MSAYEASAAVYVALATDSAVTAIVSKRITQGRSYQSDAYPQIVIEDSSVSRERETNDLIRPTHTIRVYGYTVSQDSKAGLQLKDAINSALHRATLSPPTLTFVDCVQSGLDTIALSEDGNIYESVTEFAVTLE